jgi:hypothetical protein
MRKSCASSSDGALDLLRRTGFPQLWHEFLDFGGSCFSEASFSRDDTKAAFLEDAA